MVGRRPFILSAFAMLPGRGAAPVEPTRQRSLRTTIGGLVLLVTATALSGRAGAETIIRFDGSANVVSRAAAPAYALEHGVEARPALTLQVGTPRLVWRAGYLLAYDLDAYGESTSSHFASLSLAAEPSPRTLVRRAPASPRVASPSASASLLRMPGDRPSWIRAAACCSRARSVRPSAGRRHRASGWGRSSAPPRPLARTPSTTGTGPSQGCSVSTGCASRRPWASEAAPALPRSSPWISRAGSRTWTPGPAPSWAPGAWTSTSAGAAS